MKTITLGLALVLAGALSLGGAFSQDAQAKDHKPKLVVKSLVKGPLAGVDGKEVIIAHLTIPAGFVFPKHFHPGALFVYVLEGTLRIQTEKGTITISKGEVYQEVPREVMTAENMSASTSAKIIVFQVGEPGQPMTIPVK